MSSSINRNRPRSQTKLKFRDKLILNQWLVGLFGFKHTWKPDFSTYEVAPFRALSECIKDTKLEGIGSSNLHRFCDELLDSEIIQNERCVITPDQLLNYEENIVRHTKQINHGRQNHNIVWKYFQWLTLLFVEIYLKNYFEQPEVLLAQLNDFLADFNQNNSTEIPEYQEDDLNTLSLQNATGSGKTLLMHVNLLQFRHYATHPNKKYELSRTILLTPNEDLSGQHLSELRSSGIEAAHYLQTRGGMFNLKSGLEHVDVLEITKLGVEQRGKKTVATRDLGDQNLLFVDEGHRGLSGKEQGAWSSRRAELCSKGFTFEYSATFEQAVKAAARKADEHSYAKSVIFDYSYRWFYEDGFGKDYLILNLPESLEVTMNVYLTACLLKFYQQLRIYEENRTEIIEFNLEKPMWVFVGTTVASVQKSKGTTTDIAKIMLFLADFLSDRESAIRRISTILQKTGRDTGLLDSDDQDIFDGSFKHLVSLLAGGITVAEMYSDILKRTFNSVTAGGVLALNRIKGDSGEVLLSVVGTEEPFGLINVGDSKGLCDHIEEVSAQANINLTIEHSDFKGEVFATVNESSSPINLLVGSKKFIEGWDCWRVSTMGLMHVGRGEGPQIVQLFGRGVRLKGFQWSLKRSARLGTRRTIPKYLSELETLNIFGIRSDFMEKFREFLEEEGLPGNTKNKVIEIPLNVTYDFGKNLKVPVPKRKPDGEQYVFHNDAPAVVFGDVPEDLQRYKVQVDHYPRIKTIRSGEQSRMTLEKKINSLEERHLFMLNDDEIFFELERYKNEKRWYNLNITRNKIKDLLVDDSWYNLFLPDSLLEFTSIDDVMLIQQIATELLKKYCEKLYNYRKREFFEPRLELKVLTPDDWNIPKDDSYEVCVAESEERIIQDILSIQKEIQDNKDSLKQGNFMDACNFGAHLYEPVLHIKRFSESKINIQPVSLNESEFQFVKALREWYQNQRSSNSTRGINDLFLLRNLSRGRGIGFFEAGNFHPDFILWLFKEDKQYVTFVEPHGLTYESPSSDKIEFYQRVKAIEERLNDAAVVLNSFILSPTRFERLDWGKSKKELEGMHVLFMQDNEHYIEKMITKIVSDT